MTPDASENKIFDSSTHPSEKEFRGISVANKKYFRVNLFLNLLVWNFGSTPNDSSKMIHSSVRNTWTVLNPSPDFWSERKNLSTWTLERWGTFGYQRDVKTDHKYSFAIILPFGSFGQEFRRNIFAELNERLHEHLC